MSRNEHPAARPADRCGRQIQTQPGTESPKNLPKAAGDTAGDLTK
jgi:hypothetical protein